MKEEPLKNFVDFVSYHAVNQSDIWGQAVELSLQDFIEIVGYKLGYIFQKIEIQELALLSQHSILKPISFKKYNIWDEEINRRNDVKLVRSKIECLKNSFQKYNAQENDCNNGKLKTFISGMNKSKSHKVLNNSAIVKKNNKKRNNDRREKHRTALCMDTKFTGFNKLKQGLIKRKNEFLQESMQVNVLDKKWNSIVKVSEMNKWALDDLSADDKKKQVQVPLYTIQNTQNQIVVTYCNEGKQQRIAQNVFNKRYKNAFKNRTNLQNQQIILVPEVQNKKVFQRQQELNDVLQQIILTKKIFSHQLNLLQDAQINC